MQDGSDDQDKAGYFGFIFIQWEEEDMPSILIYRMSSSILKYLNNCLMLLGLAIPVPPWMKCDNFMT